MTKNATTANGEAMPSLNRRRLLMGLAAASAAAGVVAIQTGPAEGSPAIPAENANLIRLGDLLPDAERSMLDTETAYWAIARKWESRWPLAPDALDVGYFDQRREEKGLRGIAILPDGSVDRASYSEHRANPRLPRPRSIHKSDELREDIARIDRAAKRSRPKHPLTVAELMEMEAERAMLCDKLALALEYEAACDRVRKASGIVEARARKEAAHKALGVLVGQIMGEASVTMAGVIIKSQALSAWGKAPYHQFHIEGMSWPQDLAAEILAIASA